MPVNHESHDKIARVERSVVDRCCLILVVSVTIHIVY